jgi:hypothetical protein
VGIIKLANIKEKTVLIPRNLKLLRANPASRAINSVRTIVAEVMIKLFRYILEKPILKYIFA